MATIIKLKDKHEIELSLTATPGIFRGGLGGKFTLETNYRFKKLVVGIDLNCSLARTMGGYSFHVAVYGASIKIGYKFHSW